MGLLRFTCTPGFFYIHFGLKWVLLFYSLVRVEQVQEAACTKGLTCNERHILIVQEWKEEEFVFTELQWPEPELLMPEVALCYIVPAILQRFSIWARIKVACCAILCYAIRYGAVKSASAKRMSQRFFLCVCEVESSRLLDLPVLNTLATEIKMGVCEWL